MTRTQNLVPILLGVAIATAASGAFASTFSIIDGEGFESPAYSTTFVGTGQLEGQFADTNGGFGSVQWTQSPVAGSGNAVVQTSVVASGSQAVQVDRVAGSDDRWGVFQTGFPAERYICIDWDMLVAEPTTVTGSFGPFFGVEAYDDDGNALLRIGGLGVDAATTEVLYFDRDFGLIPTPGGETVNWDEWNSFRMILDFQTETVLGVLNNQLILEEDFESIGVDAFTDAPIAALAASFDPGSQGATGTAYFDNYSVVETTDISGKIPEPASIVAALLAISLGAVRARR